MSAYCKYDWHLLSLKHTKAVVKRGQPLLEENHEDVVEA